jgi:hypothetical protein
MDTRSKIIGPEAAIEIARARRTRLVTGYFDPLLAAQAARLTEIHSAEPDTLLMAAVLDPPRSILAARARAELAAALSAVDYVIILDSPDAEGLLGRIPAAEVLREEDADRQRTRAFIEHVHRRHQP